MHFSVNDIGSQIVSPILEFPRRFGAAVSRTYGHMQIKELQVATVNVVIDEPLVAAVGCHGGCIARLRRAARRSRQSK